LGADTISSDELVHELLATDDLRDILIDRWGDDVAPSRTVDRDRVAAIVFAEPTELDWLESQLHPRVGERIARWASEPGHSIKVAEVPLLFEAGMENAFDAVICVIADERLRRQRAEAVGKHLLEGREERQLSQEEKAARADHVVQNDGSVEELERNLAAVIEKVRGRELDN
jgi:dephospho-CoA kinase